ncbi:MAG: hypothetical protein NTW66_01285 [Candidatus Magasanikbacteria bacterium]|nr:hypothetical protein [Candidatus Magasanikbacteria bacterium]
MKYLILIFVVSGSVFLAGCENNQSAEDLVMVQRDASGNVIGVNNPDINVASPSNATNVTTSEKTNTTEVEQPKVSQTKVTIINSVTKNQFLARRL